MRRRAAPPRRRQARRRSPSAPSEPAKLASGTRRDAEQREIEVERDRQHRAERRAGRDAERVGRRQRIAQQRLKDDARQRERAADERRGEHARQAGDEEDLRVDVVGERNRPIEDAAEVNAACCRRAARAGTPRPRACRSRPPSTRNRRRMDRARAASAAVSATGQWAPPSGDRRADGTARRRRRRTARRMFSAVSVSSVGPAASTRPSLSSTMRPHSAAARFRSCVDTIIVVPRSRFSRRSSAAISN